MCFKPSRLSGLVGRGGVLPAPHTGHLGLDQLEVLLRELVDVSLEGEGPFLGRPLADIFEPVRQLAGQDPVGLLRDFIGSHPEAPGVALFGPRCTPDRLPVLEHARRQGGGGGEGTTRRHIKEDAIARPHHLGPTAVPAPQSEQVEAALPRAPEILQGGHDHPELRTVPGQAATAPTLPSVVPSPVAIHISMLLGASGAQWSAVPPSPRPQFEITAEDGMARAGVLRTAHGDLQTPAFFGVATKAALKGVEPFAARAVGLEAVICNGYHLALQPGFFGKPLSRGPG